MNMSTRSAHSATALYSAGTGSWRWCSTTQLWMINGVRNVNKLLFTKPKLSVRIGYPRLFLTIWRCLGRDWVRFCKYSWLMLSQISWVAFWRHGREEVSRSCSWHLMNAKRFSIGDPGNFQAKVLAASHYKIQNSLWLILQCGMMPHPAWKCPLDNTNLCRIQVHLE